MMTRRTRSGLVFYGVMALLFTLSLVSMACRAATPTPASVPVAAPTPLPKAIELKMIAPIGMESEVTKMPVSSLIDRVNQRAKGELTIKWLGGPEVVPPFEQTKAVSTGVVDMNTNYGGYIKGEVPIAPVMMLSRLDSPAEERQRGFYDFLDGLARQKLNQHYLGRQIWNAPMYLWVKKPVQTPAELKGLKFRVTGSNEPWVTALGGVGVTVAHTELYTALERGVVDGLATSLTSFYAGRYYEVVKYEIAHEAWPSVDAGFWINLDSWNRLPKHLQDLIHSVVVEIEAEVGPYFAKLEQDQRREMIAKYGYKQIFFSPAEAKPYVALAYDAFWQQLAKDVDPATLDKVRKMLEK